VLQSLLAREHYQACSVPFRAPDDQNFHGLAKHGGAALSSSTKKPPGDSLISID